MRCSQEPLINGNAVSFTRSDYSGADDLDLASSVRPMGVVPLLALLENSLLNPTLFHLLIQHLCQLFIKVDDLCLQAVDHGLLETLCNVIYGLCTLQDRKRYCVALGFDTECFFFFFC